MLGGKCVNCGCDNTDALEINHKNGGGTRERRERNGSKAFYLAILSGRRDSADLEIRCKVCNILHYLKELKKVEGNWKITWTP